MTLEQEQNAIWDQIADVYAAFWDVEELWWEDPQQKQEACRIDPYDIKDGWTDREGNRWRWDESRGDWAQERREKKSRPNNERRKTDEAK